MAASKRSTSALISAPVGKGNSKTVITSLNSSVVTIRGDSKTKFFGCDFSSRARLRSFRETEASSRNRWKSRKIKTAGADAGSFSTNSKACKGLRRPNPASFKLP